MVTYIYLIRKGNINLKLETMKTADLKENFYIFGNKGNVWNNTAHIAQVGIFSGTTLCGTPMLSSNHAKYEGVEHIGCEACLKIYKQS